MSKPIFHHALKVNRDICTGCTHCVSVCPTEAIRIRGGKAVVFEHKCVDCGTCFNSCPVRAFEVEQDDFSTIFNYSRRVVVYPSVLPAQFPPQYTTGQIVACLYELGFTDAFEVEVGVDLLAGELRDYQRANPDIKPLISSFCPAIVRLIQVKFPSLAQHIVKRKTPLDIATIHYRKKLEDQGVAPEEIGIYYITPCAAKIAAVKSPVGEDKSSVDGVINMDFIYNKILLMLNQRHGIAPQAASMPSPSRGALQWSLTNGEVPHCEGHCMAIDEIHNVIDFLEKLELEEISGIDLVEMRACDESCAGGILNPGNRFITVDRVRKRAAQSPETSAIDAGDDREYLREKGRIAHIEPRSMLKMDEDTNRALKKLERARRMMCYLPGIDCGLCGAPSCQSLAEDIVQRRANPSDCIFLRSRMQSNGTLSQSRATEIMEHIWGKGRIEKDCTKRGAKNEKISRK